MIKTFGSKKDISTISKAKYLVRKSYSMKYSIFVTAPFFYKLLKYILQMLKHDSHTSIKTLVNNCIQLINETRAPVWW